MDVTSASPRKARMAILGVGMATGLVYALPVETGSVACPPAHEGRAYCLLQHAWAPAAVKLAAAIFVVWIIGDLLLRKLPELRVRWRRGERLGRRTVNHGRAAVLADPALAAATWGIVPPEPARATMWTIPEAEPAAAPSLAPATGLRALTAAERFARPAGPLHEHLIVLNGEETRSRRLRLGSDPALVVSCWSDAAAARELDAELLVSA
jgi:hypothetical protein